MTATNHSASGAVTSGPTGTAATFVMPFYGDQPNSFAWAMQSVKSLLAQTDTNWQLIIIDDCSPQPDWVRRHRLEEFKSLAPERIVAGANDTNRGQGVCRNMGVNWAHMRGSQIVLFQDADDIAHPRRLEVTRKVLESGAADFVYSSFDVIDEDGNEVCGSELTPAIVEILDTLDRNPPQGRDCWISIATQTGYLTLTSTVAVTTELARRHPFPDCRGSEDSHAFLRMSAGGAMFSYQPSIPAKYRMYRAGGSPDRRRIGQDEYYGTKVRTDCDGFERACALALARGALTVADASKLRGRFIDRLADAMSREVWGSLPAESD